MFSPFTSNGKTTRNRKTQLSLETLEQRDLMAAGIWLADSTLFVQATNDGDTILIQEATGPDGSYVDDYDNEIQVGWKHNGVQEWVIFNKYRLERQGDNVVPVLNITYLDVNGGQGNDTITNNTFIPSILRGGNGADTITGGYANDIIHGGRGGDKLYGGTGDDIIYANSPDWKGNEAVTDYLYGEQGNDKLYGAYRGINYLDGGEHDDKLYGGDFGSNKLLGGEGNDIMFGGMGKKGTVNQAKNIFKDNQGSDKFWGGDYATNDFNSRDGFPEIAGDEIWLGYQGKNTFKHDPGLWYDYNGQFFGDSLTRKSKPGFIQTDGGYQVVPTYHL